jgi:hypothetical protein
MIRGQDGQCSNPNIKHQFPYHDNQRHGQNDELNPIYFRMVSFLPNTFKYEGQYNLIISILYFEVKFLTIVCPNGLICGFSKSQQDKIYHAIFLALFCLLLFIPNHKNLSEGKQGNVKRGPWQ